MCELVQPVFVLTKYRGKQNFLRIPIVIIVPYRAHVYMQKPNAVVCPKVRKKENENPNMDKRYVGKNPHQHSKKPGIPGAGARSLRPESLRLEIWCVALCPVMITDEFNKS